MAWIEVIQLRASGSKRHMVEKELMEMLDEISGLNTNTSIKIYHRMWVDTDTSIVLFHDAEEVDMVGSRLGLSLIQSLKTFGMVDHSVWMERST